MIQMIDTSRSGFPCDWCLEFDFRSGHNHTAAGMSSYCDIADLFSPCASFALGLGCVPSSHFPATGFHTRQPSSTYFVIHLSTNLEDVTPIQHYYLKSILVALNSAVSITLSLQLKVIQKSSEVHPRIATIAAR